MLDELISEVEATHSLPPANFDPDDPWSADTTTSSIVYKERVTAVDGSTYLLTRPFEQECPISFAGRKHPEYFELKPFLPKTTGKARPTAAQAAAAEEAPLPLDAANPLAYVAAQVAQVVSAARHPSSDRLLLTKVDCGGGQVRQVVAGLVGHYTPEELQGRLVVIVTNLKKVRLRNEWSEAMILAGDEKKGDTTTVKVLVPPEGSAVGDRVFLEGVQQGAPAPEQINAASWAAVVPLLKVHGGFATASGKKLVTARGPIAVPLSDGAGIH